MRGKREALRKKTIMRKLKTGCREGVQLDQAPKHAGWERLWNADQLTPMKSYWVGITKGKRPVVVSLLRMEGQSREEEQIVQKVWVWMEKLGQQGYEVYFKVANGTRNRANIMAENAVKDLLFWMFNQ
jgi:hypothetical protein